ncbi:MAG: hypothetical protein ABSF17_10440 [Terracidiphilus sp.]|jgi:hypothetical protein
MTEINGRTHFFNADATILDGFLNLPIEKEIKPLGALALSEKGGYRSERVEDFHLEEVISYRSAYTQVAGNNDVKADHGWATLATVVIEGLNILEVLTADRIVGQIIADHPPVGYVPSISFLGTRFENLRIAGHPVHLELDPHILGVRPIDDTSYGLDSGVRGRVSAQHGRICQHAELPADLRGRYNSLSSNVGARETVECSLVNQASGGYPGLTFGNVLRIPNFGTITLAKVTVTHEDFKDGTNVPETTTVRLRMIDLELGCAVAGHGGVGTGSTNGKTVP